MKSHSGLLILPRNWRAYEDSDSTYRRCPSAYRVSKANEDLPDPETPVMATNLPCGIFTSMFFRLLALAPLISIYFSFDIELWTLSFELYD